MNLSSESVVGPVEGAGRRVVLVRENEVRSQPWKAMDLSEQEAEEEAVDEEEVEDEGADEVGVDEGVGTGSWGAGRARAGVRRRSEARKFMVAAVLLCL